MSAIGSGSPRAEHVAVELRRGSISCCGDLADRLQPLEPQRQRVRHVLGALALRRVRIRQQQARLQIGEPGRHHQIVGGEFEPQLARLLDEGEILVGERQDRDLREIDLLLARQRRAADRAGPRSPRRRPPAPARRCARSAAVRLRMRSRRALMTSPSVRPRGERAHAAPSTRRRSARRRSRANGCGPRRGRAPASRARARGLARRAAAHAPATACISSSLPLQWSTTSQPAASAARVRSAIEPDSAPMETSSLISNPLKPDRTRESLRGSLWPKSWPERADRWR